MAEPATRQDVQNSVDRAKSAILSSVLTRNDLQSLAGQIRGAILQDLHGMHAENQAIMRQSMNYREQLLQRIASLERSVITLQQQVGKVQNQHTQTATSISKMRPDNVLSFQRF